MSKTFGIDTAQAMTLFLAVALAIPIWATYRYDIYDPTFSPSTGSEGTPVNFVKPDRRLASFIQTWNLSLGFLFAAYAAVVKVYGGKNRQMYKWLVVLVSIVAWAFVLARPIGGSGATTDAGGLTSPENDQMDSVAKYVFGNLAAGSLFALPTVLIE